MILPLLFAYASAQCTNTFLVNGYADCSATSAFNLVFGANSAAYAWQATYFGNLKKFYLAQSSATQTSFQGLMVAPLTLFAPSNAAWVDVVANTGPVANYLASYLGLDVLSYHLLPVTISITALPSVTNNPYLQLTQTTTLTFDTTPQAEARPYVNQNQAVNIKVTSTRGFQVWGWTDSSGTQINSIVLNQALVVLTQDGYIYGVKSLLYPPRKLLMSFKTPGFFISELKRKSIAGTGCLGGAPTPCNTPNDPNLAQTQLFLAPPDGYFTSVGLNTGGTTKSYVLLTEAQKTLVLLYHIVDLAGTMMYSSTFLAGATTVTTLCNAATLTLSQDATLKTIQVADGALPTTALAQVTKVDVLLQNGVVFTLDRILIAPAACLGF